MRITLFLIATMATACITVEDQNPDVIVVVEEEDDGCDGGVPETDAAPETDASPDAAPDPAALHLLFGGPPGGTEISVGAANAQVLCFNAEATETMEIRNFRIEIASNGMIHYNGMPLYRDVTVWNGSTLVAGPVNPDGNGSTTAQTLVLPAVTTILAADTPYGFCVRLNVYLEDTLDGDQLTVRLAPFQLGDIALSDGSPLPVAQIDPLPFSTTLTVRGIQGSSVPMAPPSVSAAPPLDFVLHNGTVVATSIRISAASGSDVLVKKLSFAMSVSTANPSAIDLIGAHLRVRSEALPLGGWSDVLWYGGDCGFTATWANRCVRIVLDEPLRINAGNVVTLDLRVTVSGSLVSGDALTTGASMDTYGHQEGPLTFGPFISGGYEDSMLWSNDGLWWYNGNSVNWGTPFAHTLAVP